MSVAYIIIIQSRVYWGKTTNLYRMNKIWKNNETVFCMCSVVITPVIRHENADRLKRTSIVRCCLISVRMPKRSQSVYSPNIISNVVLTWRDRLFSSYKKFNDSGNIFALVMALWNVFTVRSCPYTWTRSVLYYNLYFF